MKPLLRTILFGTPSTREPEHGIATVQMCGQKPTFDLTPHHTEKKAPPAHSGRRHKLDVGKPRNPPHRQSRVQMRGVNESSRIEKFVFSLVSFLPRDW
jgi:hypothetical protein